MTLGLRAQPSVFHQFSRDSLLCTVDGPTPPLKKSWEISSHLTFDTLKLLIPDLAYLTLSSGSCWRNLYFSFGWTSSSVNSVKSFGITSVFNSLYLLWILKTITNREKVYPANRRGNKSPGFKLLGVILKRHNNYIKGMNWIANSQRPTEMVHPLHIIAKICERLRSWSSRVVSKRYSHMYNC